MAKYFVGIVSVILSLFFFASSSIADESQPVGGTSKIKVALIALTDAKEDDEAVRRVLSVVHTIEDVEFFSPSKKMTEEYRENPEAVDAHKLIMVSVTYEKREVAVEGRSPLVVIEATIEFRIHERGTGNLTKTLYATGKGRTSGDALIAAVETIKENKLLRKENI